MFRVMLCGASDTGAVSTEFADVVRAAGGDPWHYLDGQILYLNTLRSDYRRNSAQTVHSADLLVFVIVEAYGVIAWEVELRQALDDGKPIILMILDSTYQAYLTGDAGAVDPRLLAILTELEVDRSLTLVSYRAESFAPQLRREVARVVHLGLAALQVRNRRESLAAVLGDPNLLTPHDLVLARDVALDDTEDKRLRKQSVRALAARDGVDNDTISALVACDEQGVARLTLSLLAQLHRTTPPDPNLLEELVEVCNASDDVGLGRRLVTQAFELDTGVALQTLLGMAGAELGVRRRIAVGIDASIDAIVTDEGLIETAIELLQRSLGGAESAPWQKRASALLERLRQRTSSAPEGPASYRRTGSVQARVLEEPRDWTAGGSTLHSSAGDWWVWDDDEATGRGVAANEFPQLYAPGDEPGRYRRIGEVLARRLVAPEQVDTLEGTAWGYAGDWLVTDPRGQSWPVPDDRFTATYERAPESPDEGRSAIPERS